MKKTLYLMRHGQTLFNQQKKIQGWCDSPLTKQGIEQAKIAKEFFEKNGIVFDGAHTSTLERASDTLELITEINYERHKGLKEWNFGRLEAEHEYLNPPHVEYKLTKLGNTLLPVIESMREWGEFYKTQVNI